MKPIRALWLAIRSILWALLLPGVVAFYIPWRFFGLGHLHTGPSDPRHYLGAALVTLGVGLLAACIWEFARRGRGTLSPLDPPKELVVQGLYRYLRNPMYVAVSLILLGEALLIPSWLLVAYWGVFFTLVNVFVIGFEEPFLRRQFGESYERYTREVHRWWPRL